MRAHSQRRWPPVQRIAATGKVKPSEAGKSSSALALTPGERKRIGALLVFFIFAAVFWGAYEQVGSTLNLFADRHVRLNVFGLSFPSSWFQAVPSLMVVMIAPLFAWLWMRLGEF